MIIPNYQHVSLTQCLNLTENYLLLHFLEKDFYKHIPSAEGCGNLADYCSDNQATERTLNDEKSRPL
jgi:hypothetical protein